VNRNYEILKSLTSAATNRRPDGTVATIYSYCVTSQIYSCRCAARDKDVK
jgi:hypothetical protein